MSEKIAIVGAGQAGGRAAQALRAAGFAGRVVLIGQEKYPPYERPPLSKELVVTDTIMPTEAMRVAKNIRVISIAPLIGEAIARTAKEESVSSLFD